MREGRIFYKTKQYDRALDAASQALAMYRSVYGEHSIHRNIANTLNSMGQVCRHTGDYLIAVDFYSQALRMLCILYGDNSRRSHDVAELYNSLGKCYKEVQRDDMAAQYFAKALELYSSFPAHSCDDQIYRIRRQLKKIARRDASTSDGSSSDSSNYVSRRTSRPPMADGGSTSKKKSTSSATSGSASAAAARARAKAVANLRSDNDSCIIH